MESTVDLSGEVRNRIEKSFGRQGLMSKLGVEIVSLKQGVCELAVNFDDSLTQQNGFFHAGVTATIADTAAGYAALSVMPEGSEVLTTEFKVNLLAPARGKRLNARAAVVKAGKTLVIVRADVYSDMEHVATMLATEFRLAERR